MNHNFGYSIILLHALILATQTYFFLYFADTFPIFLSRNVAIFLIKLVIIIFVWFKLFWHRDCRFLPVFCTVIFLLSCIWDILVFTCYSCHIFITFECLKKLCKNVDFNMIFWYNCIERAFLT